MKISKKSVISLIIIQLIYPITSFAVYVDPVSPDPKQATVLPVPGTIQIVPTNTKSSQENCDSTITEYAFYEGNPISMKVQGTPQGDTKRIASSSRVLKYDPFGIFSTNLSFPSTSNIIPSNKTTTSKLVVTEVSKSSTFQRPTKTISADQKKNPVAQLCSNMHYQMISTTSKTNSFNYTYQILNATTTSSISLMSDKLRQEIQQTATCFDYYFAYCGDGTIDTSSSATDGIKKADGSAVPWHSFVLKGKKPNEVCDDGAQNGQPGKCKTDCSGIDNGTPGSCTITAPTTIEAGTTGTLTWGGLPAGFSTATLTSSPAIPGLPSTLSTTGGSIQFSPSAGGNHTFTLNFTSNNIPSSCTASSSVTSTNPTCTLASTQNSEKVSLACSANNATKYSWSMDNVEKNSGDFLEIPAIDTIERNISSLTPGTHKAICTVTNANNKVGTCTKDIIIGATNLTIKKTLTENKTFKLGDTIGYTIEFQNAGTTDVSAAKIEDLLPNGVDFINSTISLSTASSFSTGMEGGRMKLMYSGLYLKAGQTGTISVIGKVKTTADACQNALNVAYIYANPTKTVADATSEVVFQCEDNIVINKTIDKATAFLEDNISFTISVQNNGPDAVTGVQIDDIWPTGFGSCIIFDGKWTSNIANVQALQNANTSTWKFPTPLPVGKRFDVTFTATTAPSTNCAGTYTNTAKTNYFLYGKPLSKTTTATFTIIERPKPHVSILKSILPGAGTQKGQMMSFQITYRNDGTVPASFDINDEWPTTLEFVSASSPPLQGSNGVLRWQVPKLLPGQGGTIIITGKIK